MAHSDIIIKRDPNFTITPATRVITTPEKQISLVQFDHNSTRFGFQIPRYVDGHDMSICERVEVHYINVGTDKQEYRDMYEVKDLAINTENEETVDFSWLVSQNATQYAGQLAFLIRFVCYKGNTEPVYIWSTITFSGITISNGMNNGDVVVDNYADILEQWRTELFDTSAEGVENILSVKTTALEELINETILSREAIYKAQESAVNKVNETGIDGKADVLIFDSDKAKTLKFNDTKEAPLLDYKIYGNSNSVGDSVSGEIVVPVKMYGKNLWKPTSAPDSYSGGSTVNDDYSITVGAGSVGSANLNIRKLVVYTATSDGESLIISCRNASSNIFIAIAYKPYGGSTQYENLSSGTKKYTLTKGSTLTAYVQLKANAKITTPVTLYPQLEFGSIATAYEKYVEPVTVNIPLPDTLGEGDYIDYANKKAVAQGVEYDVDLPEIVANYPSTSLVCSGDMEVTYKADTTNAYNNLKNKIDELTQAVISVGGNV